MASLTTLSLDVNGHDFSNKTTPVSKIYINNGSQPLTSKQIDFTPTLDPKTALPHFNEIDTEFISDSSHEKWGDVTTTGLKTTTDSFIDEKSEYVVYKSTY